MQWLGILQCNGSPSTMTAPPLTKRPSNDAMARHRTTRCLVIHNGVHEVHGNDSSIVATSPSRRRHATQSNGPPSTMGLMRSMSMTDSIITTSPSRRSHAAQRLPAHSASRCRALLPGDHQEARGQRYAPKVLVSPSKLNAGPRGPPPLPWNLL